MLYIILVNNQPQKWTGRYLVSCNSDPTVFAKLAEVERVIMLTRQHALKHSLADWSILHDENVELRTIATHHFYAWTPPKVGERTP